MFINSVALSESTVWQSASNFHKSLPQKFSLVCDPHDSTLTISKLSRFSQCLLILEGRGISDIVTIGGVLSVTQTDQVTMLQIAILLTVQGNHGARKPELS